MSDDLLVIGAGPWGLATGWVAARRVVLAAGWDAGALAGRVPVRPVKGQIMRLRPAAGAPLPIARTVRTPSVYLAPRDGEVVVGATSEERSDTTVTAEAAVAAAAGEPTPGWARNLSPVRFAGVAVA